MALKAAELTAERLYSDERDRRAFTELTRQALADRIAKGQPFPTAPVRPSPRAERQRDIAPQERAPRTGLADERRRRFR